MNWKSVLGLLALCALLAGCLSPAGGSASQHQVVTSIQNKGSDTIVNLALAWAEFYQTGHPEVSISVTGGGSGTGIAALINGTADIANASRQITPDEISQAKANGRDPVEFTIARDAIAVVVNPSNPINKLTLQQISDIYTDKINNWSELGGENRPIVRLCARRIRARTFISSRRSSAWVTAMTRPFSLPIPSYYPPLKGSLPKCAITPTPLATMAWVTLLRT